MVIVKAGGPTLIHMPREMADELYHRITAQRNWLRGEKFQKI